MPEEIGYEKKYQFTIMSKISAFDKHDKRINVLKEE